MISTESAIEAPSHPVGSQRGQYQETTGLASPRIAGTTGRPFHGQKLGRAAVPSESRFADVSPRPPLALWIPDLEDDALPAPEIHDTPKRIATHRGPLLAANSNATRSLLDDTVLIVNCSFYRVDDYRAVVSRNEVLVAVGLEGTDHTL